LIPPVIYRQAIWGGLWALLFLIPILNKKLILKGILLSLLPTIVALFIVIPIRAKSDTSGLFVGQNAMMGIYMGILTPVFVLVINAVWGITTALWLKMVDK
jgi:hypothetical protein